MEQRKLEKYLHCEYLFNYITSVIFTEENFIFDVFYIWVLFYLGLGYISLLSIIYGIGMELTKIVKKLFIL